MILGLGLPEGSDNSYLKAFGPKDHTIKGFGAILSLRVRACKEGRRTTL